MYISALKYPSINTKLSGMYSKMITKDQFEELIKQSTTKQAIALLKSYSDDYKNLEDNPKRIKLNKTLDDILIKDIKKIYRLLGKKDKDFFRDFITIYEIKCIKIIFRRLISNNHINESANEIENWTSKIFRNIEGIEKINNYDSFLAILQNTPYYSIFSKYSLDIDNTKIFEIENKLDKLYFEKMIELSKKNSKEVFDIIGKIIDLNNIIWIYRIKRNYKFSESQISSIIIKRTYLLKKQELNKLIEANSENEIVESLNSTYYSKSINFNNLCDLEQEVDKYIYRICKKYFRKNIFNITSIYAYIIMLEKQNNDLINVIEGIRYNLDYNELQKKLVINL